MVQRTLVAVVAGVLLTACAKDAPPITREPRAATVERATVGQGSRPRASTATTDDFAGHYRGEWGGGSRFAHRCEFFLGAMYGEISGFVSCDGYQIGEQMLVTGKLTGSELHLYSVHSTGTPGAEAGQLFGVLRRTPAGLAFGRGGEWKDDDVMQMRHACP